MTDKLFTDLGLSTEVLKAIDRLGFEQPSPIQAGAIPPLLEGRDVVGQSQTGSGKTAAFAVPAIEKVDTSLRAVQALILCPTRELAMQVAEEVHKLGQFKRGLHALPIFGGQSYERQFMGLRQGAQIVIGTPGRVMDHIRRGSLRFDKLRMLVLDEADVMLDMGFREDIEAILAAAPKERQTVFFSATMPRPILELINKFSNNPADVRVEQKTVTVATIEQVYFEVDRWFKTELLARLVDFHDYKRGIIFCNTKRAVDELVDHLLAQGYSTDRLHGDMTQAMRDRVMQKFRGGKLEFLVATDVAARGIDVDDVQVVFNYDIPYDVEDYVHRIGRTGRAGRSGCAVSFVSGREFFRIRNISRYINQRIERGRIPTVREIEDAKVNATVDRVRVAIQSGNSTRFHPLVEQLIEEGHTPTDIGAALFSILREEDGGDEPRKEDAPRSDRGPRDRGGFEDRDRRGFDDRGPRDRAPRGRDFDPRDRGNAPRDREPRRDFDRGREPMAPRERSPRRDDGPRPIPVRREAPQAPVNQPKPTAPAPVPAPVPVAPAPAPVVLAASPAPAAPESPAVVPAAPVAGGATSRPKKAPASAAEAYTKIWISVGEEHGLTPEILTAAIMGESGLPQSQIGRIDIRERHVFVNINGPEAAGVLAKLKRANILGKRVKAKAA